MISKLVFNSPFELLIYVLLSAQANDLTVNRVITKLYKVANTPEKILAIGINEIKSYIKIIGLFNIKAKNIIKICQILIDKYNSKVPENRELLELLPGIGRKTASVILNLAFGWPTIAVDTHVFRVCNRTKFSTGNNVIEVEKKLFKTVPIEFKLNCHHWFIM
ncbi:MAG: endonuclease III, partial [Arsenophonus sp. ET-DL12-MAG3]